MSRKSGILSRHPYLISEGVWGSGQNEAGSEEKACLSMDVSETLLRMTIKSKTKVAVETSNGVITFNWSSGDQVVKVSAKEGVEAEFTFEEFWALSSAYWEMGRQLNGQGIYDPSKGEK